MYTLKIIRHGHKNNDPNAHGTGVEALLDPEKIHIIREFAESEVRRICRNIPVDIDTTPIDRSKATGSIVYDAMDQQSALVQPPVIDELLGSSGVNPATGEAVNLSPRAMSKIWAEAKKSETYGTFHGEHIPLYAWCKEGFDNQQANNPNDQGISLREIACRLGAYVHNKLSSFHAGPEDKLVLGVGHSGDIEPFLYLSLEMLEDRDGSDPEAMIRHFSSTGGALEPLTGVQIVYEKQHGFYLVHFVGKPDDIQKEETRRPIGIDIFQEHARWLKEHGKSQGVLEQRLRMS